MLTNFKYLITFKQEVETNIPFINYKLMNTVSCPHEVLTVRIISSTSSNGNLYMETFSFIITAMQGEHVYTQFHEVLL